MNTEVRANINCVREGITLLKYLAEKRDLKCILERLSYKFDSPKDEVLMKFDPLLLLYNEGKSIFKDKEELLEKWFTPIEKDELNVSYGELVLLLDPMREADTIEKVKVELLNQCEKEKCTNFAGVIFPIMEHTLDTPISIIGLLDDLKIPLEKKWKIQNILLKGKEYIDEVCGVLEEAIIFIKNHEDTINSILITFKSYWQGIVEEQNIISYMKEKIGISLVDNEDKILNSYIVPSLFAFNQIIITMSDKMEKSDCYFFIGVLFDESYSVDKKLTTEGIDGAYVQALKMLGDKSKFEIMNFIKDKPAYGTEIAKQMNLTTATISHHMNALISEGFVGIVREENKIYYMLKKEQVERVLKYAEGMLLG